MRSGITYQDVALAAEELQQAGEKPTIERVRAQLGSTGSNTTISKYLQVWREQENNHLSSLEKKPTPNIVQAAVDSVWQQMRGQADAEIAAIQEEARLKMAAAQSAAEDAERAQLHAHQQLTALESTYHALSAEHELLKLDNKEQRAQYSLLQDKYQALESRFNDMQTCLTQQIKDTINQHAAEISRLNHLQEQAAKERDQTVSHMKTQYETARHDMMMQLDTAKTEKEKLIKQITHFEKQVQELQLLDTQHKTKLLAAEQTAIKMTERLQIQDEQFTTLQKSIILPDDILSKVASALTVEKWFATIEHHSSQLFDKKLKKLDEMIDALQARPLEEIVNA